MLRTPHGGAGEAARPRRGVAARARNTLRPEARRPSRRRFHAGLPGPRRQWTCHRRPGSRVARHARLPRPPARSCQRPRVTAHLQSRCLTPLHPPRTLRRASDEKAGRVANLERLHNAKAPHTPGPGPAALQAPLDEVAVQRHHRTPSTGDRGSRARPPRCFSIRPTPLPAAAPPAGDPGAVVGTSRAGDPGRS